MHFDQWPFNAESHLVCWLCDNLSQEIEKISGAPDLWLSHYIPHVYDVAPKLVILVSLILLILTCVTWHMSQILQTQSCVCGFSATIRCMWCKSDGVFLYVTSVNNLIKLFFFLFVFFNSRIEKSHFYFWRHGNGAVTQACSFVLLQQCLLSSGHWVLRNFITACHYSTHGTRQLANSVLPFDNVENH